jgi:ATP-dependent helicase/nuclease subunit A
VGLKNDLAPASIIKPLKEDSKALLSALSERQDFLKNLIHLCQIPHPQAFDLDWVSLDSFYQLLPVLVACLHLEFAAQGEADFSFFAQQALFALEESDVALYFDNQLQHLLIDEFQDTSWTQLAFIQELTRNWQSEPQKTLFLVGDPMQSIYRFRHADVSIFLSIQNHGLQGIAITPLYLSQNFRSSAQLIHQFNQYFKPIFPQHDEICFGGVKFHEAIPALAADDNSGIEAYYFDSIEQQIYFIIQQLQSAKTIKTAAILVRSRSQLPMMLHLFEQVELKYQGVDLFPLANLLHIRDVWQLTQILLNPGERQHELAALHSPFCGLDLTDINCLAETYNKRSLIEQLFVDGMPKGLSEDGKVRLQHFLSAIEEAAYLHHQTPLVDVVFKLCQRLQIDAILNPKQLLDYERFLDILEQAAQDTPWPSISTIQSILEASFVSSHADFGLQVMTIHKSKGLEFDWVFMPNMGDSSLQSNPSLFYTFTANYPNLEQHRICLPHLSHNKLQYIYEWHDDLQEQYEQLRLCYVAFTRAKKGLFLLDKSEKYHKNSFRHLFAKDLFQAKSVTLEITNKQKNKRSFKRLALSKIAKNEPTQLAKGELNSPAFSHSQEQKQIGVLVHLILQWICEYHPSLETDIPWQLLKPQMNQFAWNPEQKKQALTYIQALIHEFWQHPIGQWIKSSYPFEKNEYALLLRDGHIVRTIVLDRCFIDGGTLWIIDFKTANEHQSYRVQLNRYAKAMQILYPDYPIHCGIFYLGKQNFQSWAYDKKLEFELET